MIQGIKIKKIILVSNASWTMVKFRLGLMKALIENNYDVYVISPYDEYSKDIEDIGCKFINISMDNKGSNPLRDLNLIYNLYKIYININPSLIVHYTIKPNIYGSVAAKLAKLKTMSIIPGLGYTFINENFTAKIAKYLYKFALKIPSKVWFINEDDKNEFLKRNLVDKSKVEVINGEGINTEYFKPMSKVSTNKTFTFILIARILKDKGILEYVEAAKVLHEKYKNIEFQLLGPIYTLNPSSISEDKIIKWHNRKIINYLGETIDVREFISKCDCLVLPSYREGKGMTLVEAACMGKPLIATNVPGCKDVIDDSINGYLCKVKDSTDLAEKMEKVLSLTDEQRKAIGKAGREKIVKEFDEKIVINKYLEVIEDILK